VGSFLLYLIKIAGVSRCKEHLIYITDGKEPLYMSIIDLSYSGSEEKSSCKPLLDRLGRRPKISSKRPMTFIVL
jgi:hypothetical protein